MRVRSVPRIKSCSVMLNGAVVLVRRDRGVDDLPVDEKELFLTNGYNVDGLKWYLGKKAIGRLGITLQEGPRVWPPGLVEIHRSGPIDAGLSGVAKTWEMSSLTVQMLWRIVTGQVSAKNISGPISIAEFAGIGAYLGVTAFLAFLAIISVSLGVLNLMPVPLLDGGQVLYQLVEAVKGTPLSERAQLFGQQVGIALLVVLMSLAFYNDISRHLN